MWRFFLIKTAGLNSVFSGELDLRDDANPRSSLVSDFTTA
jgi:hypothetical protein